MRRLSISWSSRRPDADAAVEPGVPSRLYWTVMAVVAAVEIAPLFLIEYLPLVDLPNHEARIKILAHYGSNPTMQKFYVVDWRPIPDLAFDLFAVPLVRLGLSPLEAGRLFLAVAALLYLLGGHLLAKAARGKRSWLGVILPLLFYNSMLFDGFINFVFGFGVFLVAYALWFRWRADLALRRLVAVSALLVVAFLCHLAAFGSLSIAIVVTLIVDRALGLTTRTAGARSLVAFLPALVLLAYSAEARGSGAGMAWGSLTSNVRVLGGVFLSYDYRLDALWLGGGVVMALAAVASSRSAAIEPTFAAVAVAFAFLFLLLPQSMITASNVNARVIPAFVAFSLCAVRLSLAPRLAAVLAVCIVVLGLSRVAVIAAQWRVISGRIAEQVQALDEALPRNASVYSVFPEDGPQIDKRERAYAHVASYATIDRNAHVSRTFAERSQQPLVSRIDERAALDRVGLYAINPATFRRYSYVWTYQPPSRVRDQLQGGCATVYDRGGFYLCRRRPSSPSS
jgi:hypothetical protein